MAANQRPEQGALLIAVEPDLGARIRQAAEAHDLAVTDYVTAILRRAVETDQEEDGQRQWSQISVGAFARDWESDEDSAYDQLPSR